MNSISASVWYLLFICFSFCLNSSGSIVFMCPFFMNSLYLGLFIFGILRSPFFIGNNENISFRYLYVFWCFLEDLYKIIIIKG